MKTKQTMRVKGIDVVSTAWLDENKKPLMLEMDVLQQKIRLINCDKSIALQEADPPELMAETLIPVRLPPGAANARSITYRITARGGSGAKPIRASDIPRTSMQSPHADRDGSVLITVVRGGDERFAGATTRPSAQELKDLTAASAYLNTNDPAIREAAAKAVGNAKDPLARVAALRRFVSDYIEAKDLGVGFATASEVIRSRQGDCSEHAVLLAALARAAGLPSRGVSGIVHASEFGGQRDVFVWHMWTQVYVDGRWVDTDAALGQDTPDATHIALGIVPFGDAGLAEMALPIWNLIGQIKVDIVEVKP